MKRRRVFLVVSITLLAGVTGVLFGCEPFSLWMRAWLHDQPVAVMIPHGFTDDASRLNQTKVADVWPIPSDPAAAEEQLRTLLEQARARKLTVAIAGARHSMGGHTISPHGIVLNMLPFNHMDLDAERRILHVGSGARWSEIVPYLDARGFSVAVMQSNNNFSVGGSLSVNCHGWQHNSQPISSTVESFRLMKADGNVVRCSRKENTELFTLALGGYGLFGVILDVELRVVPNERYRADPELVPIEKYAARFAERVAGSGDIGMVYGRLCVVPGDKTLFREAVMTVFHQAPCKKEEIPALHAMSYQKLRREIYRAQIGSQSGKEARWNAEKKSGEQSARTFLSRNQLLNEGSHIYEEQNIDRTDILHEYFIPVPNLTRFLDKARTILPKHPCDLLNVTIRNVLEDKDAFLRYADQDMFAFVMLYNQPRTAEADGQMEGLTRELIDAALECGGRYYLPYRLHATREQFLRAYPQGDEFFARKRAYDPDGLFQNQFSLKYGVR